MQSELDKAIDRLLLRNAPAGAKRILIVGCAEGALGAALKEQDPERQVYGLALNPAHIELAKPHLDGVFPLDGRAGMGDISPASLDLIIYKNVLARFPEPAMLLRLQRGLLKPGGEILCSSPNVQHLSVLRSLLAGDFQYASEGILDTANLRFFTYSSTIKLLLDAGYAPDLVSTLNVNDRADLLNTLRPFITALGLDPARTANHLAAYQYIYRGKPLNWEEGESDTPISFVVCINNEEQLQANLLSSPCLRQPSIHQLIAVRGAKSAAEGLNSGIANAVNEIVVLLHQDVYLPPGWTRQLVAQYRAAEQQYGRIGIAGFYGVAKVDGKKEYFGTVVDRHHLLYSPPVPTRVETLDELALVVPKSTKLRFDPSLGWHLYGSDFALQAKQQGEAVVVFDALCYHHSRGGFVVPPDYYKSEQVFKRKWAAHLPIFAPCSDMTK